MGTIEKAWQGATDYLVEQDFPFIVAAVRLGFLAVHDSECLNCRCTVIKPMPETLALVETRRRSCTHRASIEALGRDQES